MRGFFDPSDGNPKVEIEISGTTPGSKKKITVLFDTGHNGSLSLPILDLIEIGAKLKAFGPVTYASGYTSVVYYFSIDITIDGNTKSITAAMIENPSEKEGIAGLQLFAPYISIIDFKNKTIGFIEEEYFKKLIADSKTSPTKP